MFTWPGWESRYPVVVIIGEVLYFVSVLNVVAVFLHLTGKKLKASGYSKNQVALFKALFLTAIVPVVFLSSYMVSCFLQPVGGWSVHFFFDSMLRYPPHIFHAGLIFFMVLAMLSYIRWGWKVFDVLDAAGLYLPLTQALGGLCWLILGYFRGRYVSISIYSLHLRFKNPTLLYMIIIDICVFIFLKRLYATTHNGEWMRERLCGVVFAAYLMINATMRIVLNVFERESPLYFHLTLTQLTMVIYIGFSILMFLPVVGLKPVFRTNQRPVGSAHGDFDDLKRLFLAAGLTTIYLMAIFLIYYLTRVLMVWKWPIQPVGSLSEAYFRIFYYLPMMLIPVLALVGMKKNNESIGSWFRWGRFTILFPIGLLVSGYYSVELLVLKQPVLRGMAFWPPVIVLSLMNTFSEEVMYRLALYRAVIISNFSKWTALMVQSLVYSLIHFLAIGSVLGLFSLVYGFLLGLLVQRSKSVTQAMICHLIIDIGCIGMPLLRM